MKKNRKNGLIDLTLFALLIILSAFAPQILFSAPINEEIGDQQNDENVSDFPSLESVLQQSGENISGKKSAISNKNIEDDILFRKAGKRKPKKKGKSEIIKLTPKQLEEMIRRILIAILSKLGISIGGNIPPIGCPTGTGTPPKVPPSRPPIESPPPTTTTPPTTKTPEGTVSASGIPGLKAEMKAKYGIDAVDGDGAAWSEKQLAAANKTLATLPESFRVPTKKIQRDRSAGSGVLGWVMVGIPVVHLMDLSARDVTFQGTLVHEMTHTWQAKHSDLTNAFSKKFWPNGRSSGPRPPSVSAYGNSQPVEDMAESVRTYWQAGAKMKISNPERYEFIKNYVMAGKEF